MVVLLYAAAPCILDHLSHHPLFFRTLHFFCFSAADDEEEEARKKEQAQLAKKNQKEPANEPPSFTFGNSSNNGAPLIFTFGDDDGGGGGSETVPPASDAIAVDPALAQYRKMLKLGVLKQAVEHKMKADGKTDEEITAVCNSGSGSGGGGIVE